MVRRLRARGHPGLALHRAVAPAGQAPGAAPLRGKTVVVTGATNGIGRAGALELARRGARLILLGRDRARAEAVAAQARALGAEALPVAADLSLMSQTRRAAAEVLALAPRLDVLVDNAGAMFARRELTSEGLERTFALNHMGYFLLTTLLLERLRASAPARVVVVASDAHRSAASFPFDDLRAERGYVPFLRYAQTKLANILFARELARRLEGSGVTANALHPGVVATGFGQGGGLVGLLMRVAAPFLLSPERGARTLVHLAASPEVEGVTGRYFAREREKATTAAARDDGAARRLWELSERLAAG